MNISPESEKRFYGRPSKKTVEGDGYSVCFFPPMALRYTESGRCLTWSAEPQSKDRDWAKHLPLLVRIFTAKNWLAVDLEEPLFWDNSVERPLTPENAIIGRIEAALKKTHSKFV